jgi:hypothetical protein
MPALLSDELPRAGPPFKSVDSSEVGTGTGFGSPRAPALSDADLRPPIGSQQNDADIRMV